VRALLGEFRPDIANCPATEGARGVYEDDTDFTTWPSLTADSGGNKMVALHFRRMRRLYPFGSRRKSRLPRYPAAVIFAFRRDRIAN